MIQMEINRNLMIVGILAFVLVFVEVSYTDVEIVYKNLFFVFRAFVLLLLLVYFVIFDNVIVIFEILNKPDF